MLLLPYRLGLLYLSERILWLPDSDLVCHSSVRMHICRFPIGLQQDSAEVLINVLTQLELAFGPASAEEGVQGKNIIASLFSCNYQQQISYELQAGTFEGTPVESVFVHPIIGVEEEGKDLYDCLAELYLHGADIEYEGKKGYMMDLMYEFPPMLYIQMRVSATKDHEADLVEITI